VEVTFPSTSLDVKQADTTTQRPALETSTGAPSHQRAG
jgi:hypothetical protein